MQYERYDIKASNSFLRFKFWSEGPRGRIRKQVVFTPFKYLPSVFNLVFGDVDRLGIIDDKIITDNFDMRKVLATVAFIVDEFLLMYPERLVYFRGSTKSRGRLYRMALSNNLEELTLKFELLGFIEAQWEPFKKGRDYSAFLVRRKM